MVNTAWVMAMTMAMVMVTAMATAMANGDGKGNCDGDSNGNSNGNHNGNGKGDGKGDLRTTIGWWQLDNDNGTTTMWWLWVASNMQKVLQVLRHPFKATINEYGQFEEEETRERSNLGG
jgi:hypothetical protein